MNNDRSTNTPTPNDIDRGSNNFWLLFNLQEIFREEKMRFKMKSLILIIAFTSAAFAKLKVEENSVSKEKAIAYLQSEKTDKCTFIYYFTKGNKAMADAMCAVNISSGGGINETTYCELLRIHLNSGEIENFNGFMSRDMGDLKIKGRCSTETLDRLIGESPLQEISVMGNSLGYLPVVLKDTVNFKIRFESKIKVKAKKEKIDAGRAKKDPLYECNKKNSAESCYEAGIAQLEKSSRLTLPWHDAMDLLKKACNAKYKKACEAIEASKEPEWQPPSADSPAAIDTSEP